MTSPRTFHAAVRAAAFGFAGVLISAPASAQAAAGAQAPAAADNQTVVLSPFEVSTTQDRGFAAANSYAGGRLATSLEDTAAAYSVMNQQMIQALGITNLRDVVDWSTDSFLGLDGSGGGFFYNLPVLGNTRGSIGSAYGYRQTDFFQYFSPGDSFDVERYDIGRGPNQVLFGLGGLGGNAINIPKRAYTDHPIESLSVLFGNYEHIRTTVDINKVIIPDKLAARVDAVYENQNGWRDGDMQKSLGVYGTVTYRPFHDTEIRVNAETGQWETAKAFLALQDNFSGWDGKTVFNGPMTNAQQSGAAPTAGGTYLVNKGNNQGVQRLGGNYFVYDAYSGQNAVMNYTNMATTYGGGATATTPISGYTYANAGGVSFGTSGATLLGAYDVPGDRFAIAAANSAFRLPSERFDNMPTSPGFISHYNNVELSIDQHIGENLFLEVAGDANHVDNVLNDAQSGLQNVYLDINQTLPNGAHNPNYLEPYGEASYRYIYHPNNNLGARASAAFLKDLGKWGNYAVNAIVADQEDYLKNRDERLSIEQSPDPRAWIVTDTLRFRQYWYEPHNYAPPTKPLAFVDPITGANATITPQWITTGPSDTVDHDAYGLVALMAKYFHNRLIMLGSVRDDRTSVYTRYGLASMGEYPANWNGQAIIWRPDAPADWSALTYYPKNTSGQVTGPAVSAVSRPTSNNAYSVPIPQAQYAGDRFQNDYNPPKLVDSKGITKSFGMVGHVTSWLSGFADFADAFQPNSSQTPQIDSTNLPNVVSHGFDVGGRLSLFDGDLYVSYTHFWNYSTGNHTVPNSQTSPINGLLGQPPMGVNNTAVGNALGIPQLYPGGNDTQDDDNFGDEIEVTANLSPGWRLTGSLSFPFFYSLNADPKLRSYVAAHRQDFITILEQDGGALDTTQHPNGAPGLAYAATLPPGTVALGAQKAVDNYNSLYANMASVTAGKQIQNSAAVLNFFTDYTIQSGRLKGVDIGLGDQYRGRNIAGYTAGNTIPDPNNPAQAIADPNASPFNAIWVSGYNSVTGTLGYHFRLRNGVHVFCNLRILNLLDNRQIIYNNPGTARRPYQGNYASPARTQVPSVFGQFRAPINFQFSTTFSL